MEEKLNEIVSEIFNIDEDEVNDEMTTDNVGSWDSLNHLKLVTAVEEEFEIKLSMAEIEDIDSIGKLKALISSHEG